jgi:hypothetical protein
MIGEYREEEIESSPHVAVENLKGLSPELAIMPLGIYLKIHVGYTPARYDVETQPTWGRFLAEGPVVPNGKDPHMGAYLRESFSDRFKVQCTLGIMLAKRITKVFLLHRLQIIPASHS